jgi:hypothetical protein
MEENEKFRTIIDKWKEFEEFGPSATQSTSEFPTLLPIAMRVAAKTISQDLGGFASQEEIESVKKKVISENRQGKIDSIVDDKPFTEKKLEDDEEYKELMKKGVTPMSAPTGKLFYLDFKYGDDNEKDSK